ncbi:MAG: cation diffusion facilitator family transporter [Spirochaetia bacterium]|nr:cation diffusion facilitator family transporter [Spirochaetia bacterium]
MSKESEMATETKPTNISKKAAFFSIFTAASLFSIKIVTGFLSGSAAILASALDSALDFISSLINLFAIAAAQKPADLKHRFGYGKAEALAGFLQSVIIFLSGFSLIYIAIKKIMENKPIEYLDEGLFIMFISLFFTITLVTYQTYALRKTNSIVVKADRLHYLTDIVTNAAVIISLALQKWLSLFYIDAIAGLLLAFYVIFSSFEIFKASFFILMDRDISENYRGVLLDLIKKYHPEIAGYHDLRSRTSGGVDYIELHLEMPKDISLEKSHHLIEDFITDMKNQFPNLEIIIHADPAEINKDGSVKYILDKEEPRFY